MWHCPHCGAPQAESARCWVCRRSSTTCSTCRHFRASLAADLGYCALDPRRRPLTGLELRACWTQPPSASEGEAGATPARSPGTGSAGSRQGAPARAFVPVDEVLRRPEPDPAADELIRPMSDPFEGWESRTSLFGEADR